MVDLVTPILCSVILVGGSGHGDGRHGHGRVHRGWMPWAWPKCSWCTVW